MAKYDTRSFLSAWTCLSVDELPDGTFDAINVSAREPIRISPAMRMIDAPAAGDMVFELGRSVVWTDPGSFHAAFEPAE